LARIFLEMGKYAIARTKNCTLLGLTGAYSLGRWASKGFAWRSNFRKVRFGTKAAILVLDTEAYLARKGLSIGHELGDYLYS
jgi:hypothetical protein